MNTASRVFFLALWCASLAVNAQTIHAVTEDTSETFVRDGKVTGPFTEIVGLSLKRAGFTDVQFALYPWARAYGMALKEPNVLIFSIARTPARENLFQWVGSFQTNEYHLYRLRERSDIVVGGLDDARNYLIGVMRDDVRQQYLQERGFTRLATSAQATENFKQLLNRRVDMVPLTEVARATLCESAGIDCAEIVKVFTLKELTTDIYAAYSRLTSDDIVRRTRKSFEEIKVDGSFKRIVDSYRRKQ